MFFAAVFSRLYTGIFRCRIRKEQYLELWSVCQQEDDDDSGEDDDYDDDDDDDDADDNEDIGDGDGDGDDDCYHDVDDDNDDEVSSTSDNEQSDNGAKKAKKQSKKKIPSFSDALLLLCNPDYSLVDAYPTLCRVYAIAVAIPVSPSTAERSFSALKRVKTRIRSSMVQERLESLLSMSIERKILLKCDKERLINLYAGLSSELSKALL